MWSFLLPAFSSHHFFTGIWPPPPEAVSYEPHESPSTLQSLSETTAIWHQPETAYTHIETTVRYEIVDHGVIVLDITTTSHAATYPYGYVGIFWATLVPPGGQRGFHALVPDEPETVKWLYFVGGGDSDAPKNNTMLGPTLPPVEHSPAHPLTYFFAESPQRFALPIQIGRWRDRYYCLMIDSPEIAFSDVLQGTAVGGCSWDVSWRLKPGQTKRLHARLIISAWQGWEAIEEAYRKWPGCVNPQFHIAPHSKGVQQPFATPIEQQSAPDTGLALSKKLFEQRGKPLLQQLGLLDKCSVVCLGGTSQNAGLDDALSRDHIWGPYLTFVLNEPEYALHAETLRQALALMPDEVDGVRWVGYEGSEPRKTAVWETHAFLRMLTGLSERPATQQEWLPLLTRQSFLGRTTTERLFDGRQGQVFHDPGKRFTQVWRHLTGYVEPDVHRALLARALFRTWNAGPEYNLRRIKERGDALAFRLCLDQYVNNVLELAFCWNEQFTPQMKWRAQQFTALPLCPQIIHTQLQVIATTREIETAFTATQRIGESIKLLMKDLYHLAPNTDQPLSTYAHAMHDSIGDEVVKKQTVLDW